MSAKPKIETTNKYKDFYSAMETFLDLLEDDVTIHPETSLQELISYVDDYVKTHSETEKEEEEE